MNIKNFIKNEFKETKKINLKGNFSVPISILVDSNLTIINSHMPQDTFNIRNEIKSTTALLKK